MAVPRTRLFIPLGLSYAGMMSLAVAVNLLPVFLTTLGHALGPAPLSNEQLGRIAAMTGVGLVAGILLTGAPADRFGPRPFAVLGNLLVAVGLLLLGLSADYAAVLVAVTLMGFGAGVLDVVLSPIVCAYQPERRAAAMNWLHSFYCVGAAATVLVASLALHVGLGWRGVCFWLIPFPALVGLGFLPLRVPPLVAVGETRARARDLCRRPAFLLALLAIFLAGSTEVGLATWLPAYAETGLGYSRWTGGMSLLAFSLAMTIGRMGVGALGARVQPVPLMIGCCCVSVVLFLIGSFAPWPPVALGACVVVGLTGSLLWPSMLGVTADRFPQGGATMFGLLSALGSFGGIVMPWVVGVAADHASLRLGIASATLCPLLMAVILLGLRRPAEAPEAAAPVLKA